MNHFGNNIVLTTFGESHGLAVGGLLDGIPSNIALNFDFIKSELSRRRGGNSALTTARKEPDDFELLSGVFNGKTLGSPIAFEIRNADIDDNAYAPLKDYFRPGHADFTYDAKYGHRDWRGGGRSSARETAARVLAGAIVKQLPSMQGIVFNCKPEPLNPTENNGRHESPDAIVQQAPYTTLGGKIRCTITGVPVGVGSPVFDKLNARLAYAMMGIPSAIGFEMGCGATAASMTGKEFADQWTPLSDNSDITSTNHCGGIQGGISNGMPIEFTVTFHPVSTQIGTMICRNREGELKEIQVNGRHDRNHLERIPVIIESMAALVLADLMTEH